MNKGSTYEANVTPRDDVCITKHGLKIPVDAENYEKFVVQMRLTRVCFNKCLHPVKWFIMYSGGEPIAISN